MALTPISEAVASTGITAAQTITTGSFTPTASSTLYVAVSFGRNANSGGVSSAMVSDSASFTWEAVVLSAGYHAFGTTYNQYAALYRTTAQTSGSPASMTVTVDPLSTTDTAYITAKVFSVPGSPTVVQSASSMGAPGADDAVTLTLSSSPSGSNLSMAFFASNTDTPFVAMSTPSSWTALENTATTSYAAGALFYFDGNTSTTATSSDVGNGLSAKGGIILELSSSGGGARDPFDQPVGYRTPIAVRSFVAHGWSVLRKQRDLQGGLLPSAAALNPLVPDVAAKHRRTVRQFRPPALEYYEQGGHRYRDSIPDILTSDVTGTSATTLTRDVAVGAGSTTGVGPTGTGAPTLNRVTGAGSGSTTAPPVGTGSPTLNRVTGVGAGKYTAAGTSATTLARVTGAGVGKYSAVGTSATTLNRVTGSGVGKYTATGTGAPTLARVTAVGSGTTNTPTSGSGTPTLNRVTGAGVGTTTGVGPTGSGSPSLIRRTAAGSGSTTAPPVGTGSPTLARVTGAGAGYVKWIGTGSPILNRVTAAGSGTASLPVITGTSATTLQRRTAAGVGVNKITGSGAVTLQRRTATGTNSAGGGSAVVPSLWPDRIAEWPDRNG